MNYGQETLSLNESYANVPNDVIVKFVNYCATMIQKHVKGYQHRQRHRVVMMSIRRFKALLNSVIWGYKVRTVFKLPEVESLIDEIRYTDTGEYGDPITRNKKDKLSKTISRLLAKPLKKQKNTQQQQYDQYIQAQSKNINTKNQMKKNQYDDPISAKRNHVNQHDEQPIKSNPSMGNYSNAYDEQPIKSKGNNQIYSNAYDEQPIKAKGNPIMANYSNTYDDQPIKSKGNYSTDEFTNQNTEQPIKSRGNYVNPYDEQPIKGKGANAYDEQAINAQDGYQDEEYIPDPPSKKTSMKNKKAPPAQRQTVDPHDEIPIKAKGTYDAYDEMPIKSKGQYFDEQPIQSKGSYGDPTEDQPIKQYPKKKVPFKKKQEIVEDEIEVKKAAPVKIEEAYENEFDQQAIPKKKKQDPKLQENLKKRTKYDPRKAIEEANRKKLEEEQQQQQQSEIVEIKQPQQKIPIESSPVKTLKERIQEKVEQKSDEKNQSFEQPKKNYLKRKSKHVPLVNKKQASINSVDAEVEVTDDTHLSPKAQMQKSPSKRFENKIVDIKQVQNIQPKKETVQAQPAAPQKPQVKRITIDELEKAYNSNYMAKYESTMQQLNELNQKRIQGATGIPILTIRSRFYATFRPSEFDHVLGVLDDQYAKLQSSLKI